MATSENPQALRTFGNGSLDDVPGRFSPHDELSGDIAEAEHLARYSWVSQLATGRRVLDAGCGWGYGTAMLADAGAEQAYGVDLAPTVIEVAQQELGDKVKLTVGDVRALPYDDAAFDLVVCFEVIEHLEDRRAVIEELHRVLAPGGLLVISSPNRERSVPGNPYHVYEYTVDEFRDELTGVFPHVEICQQHTWVVSGVVSEADARVDGLAPVPAFELAKGLDQPSGTEDYMVAIASDRALPATPAPRGVATADIELRRWVSLFADQAGVLEGQRQHIEALDLDRLAALTKELEGAASIESSLTARVNQLERELEIAVEVAAARYAELATEIGERDARLERADRVREDIFRSLSWRLTAPLRKLKR